MSFGMLYLISMVQSHWSQPAGQALVEKSLKHPDCFINSLKTLCRAWQNTIRPLLLQVWHLSDNNRRFFLLTNHSVVLKLTQGVITTNEVYMFPQMEWPAHNFASQVSVDQDMHWILISVSICILVSTWAVSCYVLRIQFSLDALLVQS